MDIVIYKFEKNAFNFFHFPDKQVFQDLDFLGWYTTGDQPTDQDIKIHKQICEINECPILLQLSPQSRNFDVSKFFLLQKFLINLLFFQFY